MQSRMLIAVLMRCHLIKIIAFGDNALVYILFLCSSLKKNANLTILIIRELLKLHTLIIVKYIILANRMFLPKMNIGINTHKSAYTWKYNKFQEVSRSSASFFTYLWKRAIGHIACTLTDAISCRNFCFMCSFCH